MVNLMTELEREFGEGWYPDPDEQDTLVFRGESVDGEASWRVRDYHGCCFLVEYELGWYEQRGEAADVSGVLPLMRGMEAASSALNTTLWSDRRLEAAEEGA